MRATTTFPVDVVDEMYSLAVCKRMESLVFTCSVVVEVLGACEADWAAAGVDGCAVGG